MYKSDYHFHTALSFDAKDDLLEVIAVAAQKGMDELCVTNHYECGGEYPNVNSSILQMRENYLKAVAQNRTGVTVRFGVELGEPLHDQALAEAALADGAFDFVIASVHNVRGHKDFYDLDYTSSTLDEVFDRYYDELEEIIEWGKFDVLGHINYFERYAAKQGVTLDVTQYYPRLRDLFVKLIAKGKGIEVNASGLFGPVGKTQPDEGVLQLYKDLGGKIVTIGSDSHQKENVGRGVEQAQELLRCVGFECITVYEDHTPRFVRI